MVCGPNRRCGYRIFRSTFLNFGFFSNLIFMIWFLFAVAALNPFLEVVNNSRWEYKTTVFVPTFFIVGEIGVDSVSLVVEAKHDLVLVESTVRIVLVNDNHTSAIPAVYVIRQENIYMIAVYALRASDVAVGVLHGGFPLFAICVGATANRTNRLLNGYVKRANLNMAFLIVASFLLRWCRVRVDLSFSLLNTVAERTFYTIPLSAIACSSCSTVGRFCFFLMLFCAISVSIASGSPVLAIFTIDVQYSTSICSIVGCLFCYGLIFEIKHTAYRLGKRFGCLVSGLKEIILFSTLYDVIHHIEYWLNMLLSAALIHGRKCECKVTESFWG